MQIKSGKDYGIVMNGFICNEKMNSVRKKLIIL